MEVKEASFGHKNGPDFPSTQLVEYGYATFPLFIIFILKTVYANIIKTFGQPLPIFPS